MISGKPKIAIIVSHPIQHFCPQYVSFTGLNFCEVKIFFGSAMGYKKYMDASFGKEIAWDNLQLDSFPYLFLNGENVYPADKNLDAANLDAELATFSPDAIITYGYFQKLQRRAQSWAKRNKVPVAFIADSEKRRKRPYLVEALKYFYVRYRFRLIDHFLSVGDANEDYYKFYGVSTKKMIRMPFPIDRVHFEKIYQQKNEYRAKVRKLYTIDDDAIVFGVVGKIEAFKRQQDIIEAMGQLGKDEKKMVLLIIGAGPNEDHLKEIVASSGDERIVFTGFVQSKDLAELYAAIDVYIHPSEKDAHSLAVSEAIYMGCPVLISDRCGSYGPTDDVQENKNGFVFKTGDIIELASRMMDMAENESLRRSYGDHSRSIGVHNQELAHRVGIKSLINVILLNKQVN